MIWADHISNLFPMLRWDLKIIVCFMCQVRCIKNRCKATSDNRGLNVTYPSVKFVTVLVTVAAAAAVVVHRPRSSSTRSINRCKGMVDCTVEPCKCIHVGSEWHEAFEF